MSQERIIENNIIDEKVVYYVAERNTPFVHIEEVPISKLTKSQIEDIDYRGIYFSTRDKARQAIIKYYQYDEQ